jgi:Mn-dependent DtxR family transcriptional regulator
MAKKKHSTTQVKKKRSSDQASLYIVLPEKVATASDLTDGAKILYGIISALAKNDKSTCFARTKTLASYIGMAVRTVQNYITELQSNNYVTTGYRGRTRTFRPKIKAKDARVIIPDEVLASKDLSTHEKLAYGNLVPKGINNDLCGWNFESIDEIATLFGKSASTARRYLKRLGSLKLIKRDPENTMFITTLDRYSLMKHEETKEKLKVREKDPDDQFILDPETERVLDDLYNRI